MKALIVAVLLSGFMAPKLVAREQSQPVLARVTVYWAGGGRGSDRYTRQHKCALGTRLRSGHCAVDPKKVPYGSSIIFPDGTSLAAVDTGTAVRTRKAARLSGRTIHERNAIVIDRFFETKRQALAWANSHPHFMPVRIVPPQRAVARGAVRRDLRVIAAASSSAKRIASNKRDTAALQLPKIH